MALIDAALDGQCPAGSKPPGNGVTPGTDLRKLTLSAHPEAACNDGSPAIMYVRRATSAASAGDWVIYLQAGGSCNSYEGCRDRWCSYKSPYDAAKMSSKFAPAGAKGPGILARSGSNAFGDANQVYVYYCSSDAWTGRKADMVVDDPDGVGPSYRLHFRGFEIIQAVVATLKQGAKSDDGAETLPTLGSASRVLFSGSSAGSQGLSHALDWFRAEVPSAQVVGAFDAVLDPLPEDIDDPTIRANWIIGLQSRFASRQEYYDVRNDDSCVAAHPGADAYLCDLPSHVRLNHITTPYFLRQDLRDPVQYGYFELTGASLPQFATAVRKTALRVPDIRANAEEKANIVRAPGVHVSNCAQHIVLLNNAWFGVGPQGNAGVETANGTPITLHDALGSWILGNSVTAIDTEPSSVSVCAASTSDQ